MSAGEENKIMKRRGRGEWNSEEKDAGSEVGGEGRGRDWREYHHR